MTKWSATAGIALALLAPRAEAAGPASFISFDEARPILVAMRDALPAGLTGLTDDRLAAAWPEWVKAQDREVRERLAMYGSAIGLAFQIVDDILGEAGDPRRLGKPVGRDAERKKLTYPRLLGIKRSRELAAAKAQEALASIDGLGPASDPLRALGNYVLHRNV